MSSKKHAPKTDLELAIAAIRAEEKVSLKALKQVAEEEIRELKKSGASSSTIQRKKHKAKREISAQRQNAIARIRAAKVGKKHTSFGDFDSSPKEMRKKGPFDSFGKLQGYEAAGQSAGNRIEAAHPGFYNAVKDIPNILRFIYDIYTNNFHDDSNFYEIHGNDYFDADRYEVLVRLIAQQYGVEVLV